MRKIIFFAVLMQAVGCAHYHKTVPDKTDPKLVKVMIGSDEVATGDTLNVFKTSCTNAKTVRGNAPQVCKHQTLGQAKVVEVLDQKSSLVEPLNGIQIDETMHLERPGHAE